MTVQCSHDSAVCFFTGRCLDSKEHARPELQWQVSVFVSSHYLLGSLRLSHSVVLSGWWGSLLWLAQFWHVYKLMQMQWLISQSIMFPFGHETLWLHCQNLIPQDQKLLSEDHLLRWSLHYPNRFWMNTAEDWYLKNVCCTRHLVVSFVQQEPASRQAGCHNSRCWC